MAWPCRMSPPKNMFGCQIAVQNLRMNTYLQIQSTVMKGVPSRQPTHPCRSVGKILTEPVVTLYLLLCVTKDTVHDNALAIKTLARN